LDEGILSYLDGDQQLAGRYLTQFGERDGRFLSWGAAATMRRWLRGRHVFPRDAAPPFPIGNQDRVLLVGDWGSGIPRAQQVATAMRSSLEQAVREGRRCHVIHLGDTYYTGTEREYRLRFLAHWPVYPTDSLADTSSWCLNANHDMYSGGYDYFDYLLKEPRFSRQGRSSYFSLENDHWQLLGLDSAYADGDFYGAQPAWVEEQRLAAPQKAGGLLTHHQPFSAFETSGPLMLDRLRLTLNRKAIRAWFWGHEHRCAIYKPRGGIEYPRLIGHGGVPVWTPQGNQPDEVTYEFGRDQREYLLSYGEKFQRFGFAELTFDRERLEVRYITELGNESKKELLTAHA
jgi:hypothetical protein